MLPIPGGLPVPLEPRLMLEMERKDVKRYELMGLDGDRVPGIIRKKSKGSKKYLL
jgi:hypothetical protein